MSKDRGTRLAGLRRRSLITAVALVVPLTMLGAASSALATPKGIFKVFQHCPTSVPGVTLCSYSEVTSGEFAIGKTSVPIEKGDTITLQSGGIPDGLGVNSYFLVPPIDGTEAISKTELNVPGGLTDLVNCTEIKGEGLFEKFLRGSCKAIFENKVTGVSAITETAANATNPPILNLTNVAFEEGVGLVFPIRVHLINPLLGSSCYIGSEASPIELNLTTGATSPPGPNKSIHGSAGKGSFEEERVGEPGHEEEGEVSILSGASLVDNAFSVPTAEGCGFAGLLDGILDSKLGLESKAGNNTAIQTGTLKSTFAQYVRSSEK